jgi:hypothetical protein
MLQEMDDLGIAIQQVVVDWMDEYGVEMGDNEPVYDLIWRLKDAVKRHGDG